MKILHTILTVLFGVALIFGLIPSIQNLSNIPSGLSGAGIAGIIFGNLAAYAVIPGIIWTVRYFVGKNIDQEQPKESKN